MSKRSADEATLDTPDPKKSAGPALVTIVQGEWRVQCPKAYIDAQQSKYFANAIDADTGVLDLTATQTFASLEDMILVFNTLMTPGASWSSNDLEHNIRIADLLSYFDCRMLLHTVKEHIRVLVFSKRICNCDVDQLFDVARRLGIDGLMADLAAYAVDQILPPPPHQVQYFALLWLKEARRLREETRWLRVVEEKQKQIGRAIDDFIDTYRPGQCDNEDCNKRNCEGNSEEDLNSVEHFTDEAHYDGDAFRTLKAIDRIIIARDTI